MCFPDYYRSLTFHSFVGCLSFSKCLFIFAYILIVLLGFYFLNSLYILNISSLSHACLARGFSDSVGFLLTLWIFFSHIENLSVWPDPKLWNYLSETKGKCLKIFFRTGVLCLLREWKQGLTEGTPLSFYWKGAWPDWQTGSVSRPILAPLLIKRMNCPCASWGCGAHRFLPAPRGTSSELLLILILPSDLPSTKGFQ